MDRVTVDFKAAEVFDLARQMEAGGSEFYRHAAIKFPDAKANAFLLKLAEMEDGHGIIFSKLKECYRKKAPSVEAEREAPLSDYLQSWVRGWVFDSERKPLERLAGLKELDDILRLAMQLEKDAIAFYSGLREMVREEDRWVIGRIIDHELMHLTTLGRVLREGLPPDAVESAIPPFDCTS